jgi:hypothetical protein
VALLALENVAKATKQATETIEASVASAKQATDKMIAKAA